MWTVKQLKNLRANKLPFPVKFKSFSSIPSHLATSIWSILIRSFHAYIPQMLADLIFLLESTLVILIFVNQFFGASAVLIPLLPFLNSLLGCSKCCQH